MVNLLDVNVIKYYNKVKANWENQKNDEKRWIRQNESRQIWQRMDRGYE